MQGREEHCAYCGKALHLEYFFQCHQCERAYCYIHISRHANAHKAAVQEPETLFA